MCLRLSLDCDPDTSVGLRHGRYCYSQMNYMWRSLSCPSISLTNLCCLLFSGIQFRLPSSCSVDRANPPPAVTHTPSYKAKTPPPVPPRATSKPLISVTAQSSTDSTQDAYHEGRHPRGSILWAPDGLGGSGRNLYNSTDSLDSAKAVTLAMETAAGKRHASMGSHSSVQTCDKAVLVSKAEEYLKTPRSSIGIQARQVHSYTHMLIHTHII
ncbi:disks large-associated protein 2 [Oncorhynchus keta]|uniref:disks large-associated protein 2 n=1 Tax=Oncorhynchus keta TaxID=8018 RepID=UPI00227D30D0|nr:disks large-associated protein 2 [Oncorhynchus keta]